jgi:tetratricopeptide (TPR) repeat protein
MKRLSSHFKMVSLFLICASVLIIPQIFSRVLVNASMFKLRSVVDVRAISCASSYNLLKKDKPVVSWIINNLQRAVTLSQDDFNVRWSMGRAALLAGEEEASVILSQLWEERQSPLLYYEFLTALSYNEQHNEVIELYKEASDLAYSQVITDMIALAHLEVSQSGNARTGELEKVLQLRPEELYANYFLWKRAVENGEGESASFYRDRLAYFSLDAIHPADDRLLKYGAEVIPVLLEEGLWDREKALNVIAFLVWRHSQAPEVALLLENVMRQYPADPDWVFYLAELYHRQGEFEEAKEVYRRVFELAPDYAQVSFRLGSIAELTCSDHNSESYECWEDAIVWYRKYYELKPDDLLVLRKLTEITTLLEQAESFALQEKLRAETDNRYIVSELLNVAVENVQFGPNLVENGGFETWVNGQPQGWVWSDMTNYPPFNQATFVGGRDSFSNWQGQSSARVDGLWIQQQPDKSLARAGYWLWNNTNSKALELKGGTPYILSFYYRTSDNNSGWIWLSKEERLFWSHDRKLVATNGQWLHFVAIDCNVSAESLFIRPLIRSYASGRVEFDDLQLRNVLLDDKVKCVNH